jgi:hypothetical protein
MRGKLRMQVVCTPALELDRDDTAFGQDREGFEEPGWCPPHPADERPEDTQEASGTTEDHPQRDPGDAGREIGHAACPRERRRRKCVQRFAPPKARQVIEADLVSQLVKANRVAQREGLGQLGKLGMHQGKLHVIALILQPRSESP